MNKLLTFVFSTTSFLSFGQKINSEKWTDNELAQYSKLADLAKYIHNKNKLQISKDSLFNNYIYFDYILNDTVSERQEKRLQSFDTIFYYFRKTVDSLGLENLDAKPVRFYKNHEIYNPFNEDLARETVGGEKMNSKDENVFAYYRKDDPENPIGTLLFEPKTNKLVAWIMINQGGHKYFLTFNML